MRLRPPSSVDRNVTSASIVCGTDENENRSQSIGYREIKIERMFEEDKYIGTHLVEIEMLETSWVPLPMNQDAVRSADAS